MSDCDNFICELCMESVNDDDPHVRLGVDAVVRNKDGSYSSLINGKVMVFAVFHNECVRSTYDREDCSDIQYIEEARTLLSAMDADASLKHNEEAAKVRRFVCLQGGLHN